MSDLTDFLLARLAEDHAWAKRQERVAIRTHHLGRRGPHPPDHYSRVLADVEAKQRIVEWASMDLGEGHGGHLFRLLALPYADHPDYRPEWRP